MATVELNEETFKDALEKGGTLLIDWWAPWCGPCRAFAPTYEEVSNQHPDVTFAKVNTEDQRMLGEAFQIRSIPTLMVFRDRILLFSQAGALPGEMLSDLISKVKAVDMDQIRAHIAQQEAEQTQSTAIGKK